MVQFDLHIQKESAHQILRDYPCLIFRDRGDPRIDTRLLLGMLHPLNWEMGTNLGRGGDFIPINLDEI